MAFELLLTCTWRIEMKKFAVLLPALLVAVSAPLAQAALSISWAVSPGTAAQCGGGTGFCSSEAAGAVTLTDIAVTSNSPGAAGVANEFGSTLEIANTGSSAATITLWFSSTGFTTPTAPPTLNYSSEIGITGTAGTASAVLTSCVDTDNQATPPAGTFCEASPAGGEIANQSISVNVPASIKSNNNTSFSTISSLSGTYSLEQMIVITLGADSTLNLSTSQVLSSVPEPTSVILLGSLLIGVGLVARRKLSRIAA
jgi:hypothetical protein